MGKSFIISKKPILPILCLLSLPVAGYITDPLERCYGVYGCFSLGGKFLSALRPFHVFPYSASIIAPKLDLFTRRNSNISTLLNVDDASGLNQTNFNFSMPTKMIVHGFEDSGTAAWCITMKDELLINNNFNVIIADWTIGAQLIYIHATVNTRLVGAMIARFIQLVQAAYGYPPEMYHIIGHSLGAHVAGYVGKRVNKLGRISGMDPAGPYFQDTDPVVRLDKTDALFVDVIHTNAGTLALGDFGINMQVGHVDIYPNGGASQPDCSLLKTGINNWVGCSHIRSHQYYIQSINNCTFESYACSDYNSFKNGHCNFTECFKDLRSCALMGFKAFAIEHLNWNSLKKPKKLFLTTTGEPPYCIQQSTS